jgi:hypothetical protein
VRSPRRQPERARAAHLAPTALNVSSRNRESGARARTPARDGGTPCGRAVRGHGPRAGCSSVNPRVLGSWRRCSGALRRAKTAAFGFGRRASTASRPRPTQVVRSETDRSVPHADASLAVFVPSLAKAKRATERAGARARKAGTASSLAPWRTDEHSGRETSYRVSSTTRQRSVRRCGL